MNPPIIAITATRCEFRPIAIARIAAVTTTIATNEAACEISS